MTKMCERAAYMKVRPNETVYLPRPAVLITGHLSRVYAGEDGTRPRYSGIAFLPNSNPTGDRKFDEFVYVVYESAKRECLVTFSITFLCLNKPHFLMVFTRMSIVS